MQYGQQYRILRVNGEVVEGKYIQTKGNDDEYPSFELGDGSLLGVHINAVLGPVIDNCPVDGIDRIDCDILDAEAEDARFDGYADSHIYGTQIGGVLEFVEPNDAEEWGHIVDDHEDIPR